MAWEFVHAKQAQILEGCPPGCLESEGCGVPSFRVCAEHKHNRDLLLGCGVLSLHSSMHIFPVPLITWWQARKVREIYAGGFSVNVGNICLLAVRRKPGNLLAWEQNDSERKHWWRRDVVPGMLPLESLSRLEKNWHLKLTNPAFKLTSKACRSEKLFRADCELILQIFTVHCKTMS